MNREVHVRFWESPEVKVLRATRPTRICWPPAGTAAYWGEPAALVCSRQGRP